MFDGLVLLAQDDGMRDLAPWASLAGNGIIAMLLVWFITQRDPKKDELHRLAVSELMAQYRASMNELMTRVNELVINFRAERAQDRIERELERKLITEISGGNKDVLTKVMILLELINDQRFGRGTGPSQTTPG